MHFNILALAALLATGVVGQDDAAVAKDTSVYFCKDTKFEGPCISIPANIDECVDLPSGYAKEVSSLRPDPSAGYCLFHKGNRCTGAALGGAYPGYNQLTQQFPDFNDAISSFTCYG